MATHKFTVIFQGMICHVGDVGDATKKTHCAIVVAQGHKPRVFVYRADTIDGKKDFDEPLLKGDRVEFENLDAGSAEIQTSFDKLVPKLKHLLEDDTPSDKDLDDKVKHHQHDHKAVVAYVIYRKGKLEALYPVPKMLKLTFDGGNSEQQCVAEQTQFTADASKEITVVIYKKNGDVRKSVKVRPGARAWITNSPDSPGNHFHHYRELTKAEGMAQASAGSGCTEEALVSNNPECTNSGWP